ncbi:MAG: enoyl-CoA hydratase/isomerase family protein [Planctomycetes bacterium]|nr:enoyl-CoA hydratase/isomerase family protein [Planctomycetota bacterium]
MPGVTQQRAHDGKLLRLTIDQPKGNIFSGAVMRELTAIIRAAQSNRALRAITLEAEGKHFSFGASVEEHTAARVAEMLPVLRGLVLAISGSEIPVAALVQGMCLGGAFEVVLACHFVFASTDARMGVPEIRLGVFPPVAAVLLPRRLGQAVTDSMILTGEEWSGERLHGMGLTHQVYPADSLRPGFEQWFEATLGKFSGASLRQAVKAARAAMLVGLGPELEAREQQYVSELMKLEDANEGIAAFLERRTPQWRDA